MTPYHPLTSTGTPPDDAAMIWPWPHNWSAQVVRRPEWSTVVLTSATGTEQRQALREYPREQVTYEHLLEGDDAALAFTLLRVWKGRDWLVPDWTEATKTTAPAGAVLSLARSSVPAGLALLGTEVVTLLDADGTLDVSPSGSWPAGTVVVPLRLATLDADQTVSHVTGTVSRISPTFLFSEPVQVDETVLTRVTQPAGVTEVRSGISWVPGRYGDEAVMSSQLTLARGAYFRLDRAHTFEFWIRWPEPGARYESVMRFTQASAYVDANIMDGALALQWLHPFSTTAVSAGAWTHIAVTRDDTWTLRFFVNGHLKETHADFYQTTDTAAGDLELFTASPPGRSAFSGSLNDVRMTHACRYTAEFTPSPCVIGESDPYWSDVAFVMNGEVSRWGRGPNGPLAATENPRARMLPWSHNYASSGSTKVSRELDELDPGVGMRHTRPRRDMSTSQWVYDTLLDSDLDILAFRALLQQHKGSAIGMYASPLGADLEVVEIVDGVATVPGSQFWGSAPPALDLLTPRGWECRKVASVSPSGVVLQNAAVQAAPGEVVSARAVYRVRVLGDAVEIRYHTPGVAEVSLPVVSTPDPFDAGGGGGGTTGGGWTEVAVPVIPPPAPAGQVVLLVRGESWPLVDASPVARSLAVAGIMDAEAGGSPALFGSTTSVRALMFPPAPFATATASTTITAAGDFCAECFVRIPVAGTGLGNVRVFSFGALTFRLRDSSGSVSVYDGSTLRANVDGVFSLATWYHVAVTRRDGVIYVYLNGVMVLQYAYATSIDMTTVLLFRPLAYYSETIGAYFKYARITTGDSVYNGASFPPLTSGY